ncbi:hypothetical protein [Streptomyces sp. FH025]|uniref:hypothetical protein n=1 Tax=Streptomyces sp. FH025 TaxID=2815937 RepID=UPI001A9FEB9B|nr:hypothetical protein [Streptomyces sp. FH025]MBO1414909.1 hypothetical protein [Streptomyces sp. FH025]
MNRTTTRRAATVTASLLLAGAAALGIGGQAMAATVSGAPAATQSSPSDATTQGGDLRIVPLPAHRIGADQRPQEFTVRYTDGTSLPQALQILVVSPEHGPYLQTGDVRLERFDATTRHWEPVDLGSQTGTLYTRIPPTGRIHADGDTTVRFRITATHDLPATLQPLTVQPRSILYTAPQTSRA